MGNYIPYQPRTMDDLLQGGDPMMESSRNALSAGNNPLMFLLQGLTAAERPQPPQPDTHQGGFKGYLKEALGKFMYSFGEGLKAGGGVQGMGAAINAPFALQEYRKQQEQQQQQQELANQMRRAQLSESLIRAYSALAPKQDTSMNEQELLMRAAQGDQQAIKALELKKQYGAKEDINETVDLSPLAPLFGHKDEAAIQALKSVPRAGIAGVLAALKPAKDSTTLSEELANLLTVPESARTPEQKTRIAGIQGALTTVANQYGENARDNAGSFVAETDAQGNVLGYVNNKTGEKRPPAFGGRRSAQSFEERRAASNARSGLRAITTLREMLSDKGILAQAAIPGSLGARKFAAARKEMVDVLTRLRTGAALNKEEEEFYAGQAPTLADLTDTDAIEYKLGVFEQLFNDLTEGGRDTSKDKPASGFPRGGGGGMPKVGDSFQGGKITGVREKN